MSETILRTEDVSIHFGGLVAVDKVSIHLDKGEILGLIGTNGAGKTTLFNMIAGALKPTGGHIYYHDRQIGGMKSNKVCKLGIGRTYQVVQPFTNLTVLDNVTVGCLNRTNNVAEAKEKAAEIVNYVGLGNRMNVVGASLGLPDLKRMEIARALGTQPEILLLDEVMAGLNPTECQDAMDLVMKIRDGGMTIIVIEHVMKAIMNISDRIYVMNQGRLIAEGTPAEISTNQEVIDSYLGGTVNAAG